MILPESQAVDWHNEANDAIDNALTNSPVAAQELLEKLADLERESIVYYEHADLYKQLLERCERMENALNNVLNNLICDFTRSQHLPPCYSFENPYGNWCSSCKRRKQVKEALQSTTQQPSK